MLIFPGDHECGSSSQRTLSVQEAAAYLKVSSVIRLLIAVFLKFIYIITTCIKGTMHLINCTVTNLGLLFGGMWADRENRITQHFLF